MESSYREIHLSDAPYKTNLINLEKENVRYAEDVI